jgi:predicted CoA-substrate-specific enzyme activase
MYFAGIDIGSATTKVVIMNGSTDGKILTSILGPTGPEHRRLVNRVMEEALGHVDLSLDDLTYIVATGYGRISVPFADKQITEISCHARGIVSLFPTAKTVIDIGGQDCKGIKIAGGRVQNFVMNDKCAAGTGRFLEVTAEALGLTVEQIGPISLRARSSVKISSVCTVFAEQEIVSRLAEGVPVEDILAGVHDSIAARVYGMIERIVVEKDVVLTGGGAKNVGLRRAIEDKLGYPLLIPPEPSLTGAIGAALLGAELARKAAERGQPVGGKSRHLAEATFFT